MLYTTKTDNNFLCNKDTTDQFMDAIRRTIKLILSALLVSLLSAGVCPAAETGRIIVNIEGINAEEGGNLAYALFDAEGSWPKYNSALMKGSIPVSAPTMRIEFDSIVVNGYYALQVIHDKNTNDKLDMRWFPYPKPKEGVGVSNNNKRLGPPQFEKALFQVSEETTTINIQLNY